MTAAVVKVEIPDHRPGVRNVFEVSPITYAGAMWCECGHCLTAVSSTVANVDRMLNRKHDKHARAAAREGNE